MKIPIDIKRLKLFVWIGIPYLLLWMIYDKANYAASITTVLLNNIWRGLFLIPLNFIFFEYTLRFMKWRWKRVLLSIFLLWIHMILYSYGLLQWRALGAALHIYTPLNFYTTTGHGLEAQFSFSVSSIFFFGV